MKNIYESEKELRELVEKALEYQKNLAMVAVFTPEELNILVNALNLSLVKIHEEKETNRILIQQANEPTKCEYCGTTWPKCETINLVMDEDGVIAPFCRECAAKLTDGATV